MLSSRIVRLWGIQVFPTMSGEQAGEEDLIGPNI